MAKCSIDCNYTERTTKRQNSQDEEPVCEPLDLMRLPVCKKDKTQKLVSALHIGFMSPREYVSYVPLPSLVLPCIKLCNSADEEEWLERMICLEEDLHWLLRLPHHRFWSQVVFDLALQKCLQSYLSFAPRTYEFNFSAKEELVTCHRKIHKLVFSVFLRMSTYKESKIHHITPAVFGNIVYDEFLFDIARIMDICALYAFENQPIVSKMVNNLFTIQPKFFDDLNEACSPILMAFDSVEEQLQNLRPEASTAGILTNGESCVLLNSISLFELLDIVNYITDTSATLCIFLECFTDARNVFLKHGACTRISLFYDSVVTEIENEIRERQNDEESDRILDTVVSKLTLAKTFLIKAVRSLLSNCIEAVLDAKCSDADITLHVESYLQIVSDIVIGVVFKHDYNLLFPFEADLELLIEAGVVIDSTRVNYILESVQSQIPEMLMHSNKDNTISSTKSEPSVNIASKPSITNLQDLAASLSVSNVKQQNFDDGAMASKPSEAEVTSAIHYICDIFKTLGEGFVEACLEYYNYDAEKVIDALLAKTLPEHLEKLSQTMERKKLSDNTVPEAGATSSVLSERRNIFDYDEFDIFNREDVPMDRIHLGKNNKTPNVYELLADAKDSALLKELTLQYGEDDRDDRRYEPNMYDDEYDDTYDSVEVTVPEPEAETELLAVRPFTTPRVLSSYNKKESNLKVEEEAEKEEEEEVTEAAKPAEWRDQFCENPEEQRQRYQQRQETREQNRYRKSGPPRSAGSESHTESKSKSHQNKERHKGKQANHNRRQQSDFKRSRGMAPF